jgi:hypothetical protein
MSETSKGLEILVSRRHPEYKRKLPHWNFLDECYNGGREWFAPNIFRYLKEGDIEYRDRVERAYRFNHTREVVDLVSKYIFKTKIYRNEAMASQSIKDFWEHSTKGGSSIKKFMREVCKQSSIYGRIWIVVDNNNDGSAITIADEKNKNLSEYAYIVKPQNVLDMSYDDRGIINWILIQETYREDDDPFFSTGNTSIRYRLWTKTEWFLLGTEVQSDLLPEVVPNPILEQKNVFVIESGVHNLGVVPVFAHDHSDTEELYTSPSLICDIAYLDRAVANYLSNLDAIIQDQSFSQLAMPAQGVMPHEDAYNKMTDVGTKRIFLYDGESGAQPFFLSPDPRQAELIITAISKIINEIYHTVGMAGERTKQDNAVGIDNSSGVAKAYDFERVNALLTSKGSALEKAEVKMMELVSLWNGESFDAESLEDLVIYPETYDVKGLSDEFGVANSLILAQAPMEMRKEQMRILSDKLFPIIDSNLKEKINSEIEAMTDPIKEAMKQMVASKSPFNAGPSAAKPAN